MQKILYLGWIGFGNLGDELLWHQFRNLCAKHIPDNEIQITPSFPGVDIRALDKYDLVVLGGGSLFLPGYLEILNQAHILGKKIMIWGTGVDWIGKQQLEKLLQNEPIDLKENFKDKDKELLQRVLEKASFVGVRGPLTKGVIHKLMEKNKSEVEVIGDPGLLLVNSKPKEKEQIIGINWGTTFNRMYGGNEELVENELVEVGKELIQSGYKLLIYTVWTNDIEACERLNNKINDKKNVTLDKTAYKEQQLISLLSKCYLTVNFKLHANLLSYAAGTPSIPLGYRFKVYDFCSLLELQHYIVSTDSPSIQTDIFHRIRLIETRYKQINEKYKRKQEKYISRLEAPFKNNLFL